MALRTMKGKKRAYFKLRMIIRRLERDVLSRGAKKVLGRNGIQSSRAKKSRKSDEEKGERHHGGMSDAACCIGLRNVLCRLTQRGASKRMA